MKPFILASGSPRRKQLLEQVHYTFQVVTSSIDEQIDPTLTPEQTVQQLALQKAKDIAIQYPDAVVLGADTVVAYEDHILGKPSEQMEAKEMLSMLAGKAHNVFTGVALVFNQEFETFAERTSVQFWPLTEEEINAYVESGEPFDKAGSYGIQGFGSYLVKEIKGDYFNVVGLPLARTMRALEKFGVNVPFEKNRIS
ncbi:Maf family protein [Halalkalibacterium ligniniphilum]|uniref:Maf family protein n=1 Tax=Halalkalibacterium ligniniphilum TaxID=1134413 RepID=UPI00034B345E|nr:Maf family protein [Halalkalibacterium ligniniphilum]